MTPARRRAMIAFTRKVEAAYRAAGKKKDAEAARRHRAILEKKQGEV